MKIALVHDSILPAKNYGGIERVVLLLAREYERAGHKAIVVCREGSPLKEFETLLLPKDFSSQDVERALPKDCDFVHFHQPLKEATKIPYLVTIHGNGQDGEFYLPNTNFLSLSHAKNHSSDVFVYNGVDASDFPFVTKKENYFVFLARAKWRVKNLKTAIAMCRDLGVRLEVIGGEGVSTKHVKYHGSIGEKEGKLEILSKARALLYPTNWQEPFGLALTEAWACGTPVITSVNGAMDELVNESVGYKCQTYNEFVSAGKKIDSISPEVCRRYVEEKFSGHAMAEGYLKLIRRILKDGSLNQDPKYAFKSSDTHFLYKPTLANKLRLSLTGRV